MSISSIDELLMGGTGNSMQPETPEHYEQNNPEVENKSEQTTEYEDDSVSSLEDSASSVYEDETEEAEEQLKKRDYDEYGNDKEPENEAIRERLARQARKHQAEIDALRAQLAERGVRLDVQQAAKDFEYDPEASGDWQQQLAQFVKHTVNSMSREQEEIKSRKQEEEVQAQFESKFRDGIQRFDDFREVMTSLPFEITNPMTLATRALDNPAAFLYAAAKQQPKELERISRLRDPYAQMTEMGKLEERMRRNKLTTKAPRPLGRTPEDSTTNTPKKQREPNGDDLLARADAKRLATVKQRHRGNR